MAEWVDALGAIKARWMVGGSAADVASPSWREAAGKDTDLALLAIACQAQSVAMRPQSPETLSLAPALPRLAVPTMPEALRGRFRAILGARNLASGHRGVLIRFLANCGASVHPMDLVPAGDEPGLPDLYAPWLRWRAGQAEREADELTDETWEEFAPAERRDALMAMRRHDPQEARRLIEAHGPAEAADARQLLMASLKVALSPDDALLLKTFRSDRSAKVRETVEILLARLGIEGDRDAAKELADFYEVAKMGLRRGTVVQAKPLKTNAQRNRRRALCERATLSDLSAAMGMDPSALIADLDLEAEDLALVSVVARTGDEASVEALLRRVIGVIPNEMLDHLIRRLDDVARSAVLAELLKGGCVETAAWHLYADLGRVPFAMFEQTPDLQAALDAIKMLDDSQKERAAARELEMRLFAFGVLADQDAAERLMARFTETGLMAADPTLAVLSFNACLSRRNP